MGDNEELHILIHGDYKLDNFKIIDKILINLVNPIIISFPDCELAINYSRARNLEHISYKYDEQLALKSERAIIFRNSNPKTHQLIELINSQTFKTPSRII